MRKMVFTMVKILHITDSHEYANGVNDAIALMKYVGADFNICTGDIVQAYFEQPITQGFVSNFACTIGNHDAILKVGADPNGYRWDMRPSTNQLYEKFIKPCIDSAKINIEAGHTCWTKDISDDIVVIGLNDCADDNEQAYQKDMLTTTLNMCRSEGKKAIIASHYMHYSCKVKLGLNFTCDSYYKNWNNITNEPDLYKTTYKGITENFKIIESYSDVILFTMHGHEHSDAIALSNNVNIVLGSILNDTYNDVRRSNEARTSRTVANLYEISDGNHRYLNIYRLGANVCKPGNIRSMIAIDLKTHEIVSSYSL